jgi:hypothetical protein
MEEKNKPKLRCRGAGEEDPKGTALPNFFFFLSDSIKSTGCGARKNKPPLCADSSALHTGARGGRGSATPLFEERRGGVNLNLYLYFSPLVFYIKISYY